MGGGLHLASIVLQLAVSPGPIRVLASGGSWRVWPFSVVHESCSSRRLLGRPLGACAPEGSGPTAVGETGFPEQGIFPVRVHTCLSLNASSQSPSRSLSVCLHYPSALPACKFLILLCTHALHYNAPS
jgi:hypothetical protein